MNVYDFDKTIFEGDSTARFLKYLFRRQPSLIRTAPAFLLNGALFVLKIRAKQDFKQRMFRMIFSRVDDIDACLKDYWDKNITRIMPWYIKHSRADDVVITASPEFLVKHACDRIGVSCTMGSPVDKKTGDYSGKNCHGAEKVRRFYERFPNGVVDEFFSDSHSDDPMAEIAKKAYLIRGDSMYEWNGR